MIRAISGIALPIVAYVVIALALNGVAGVMQPPMGAGPGEGILTTFAADGGDPYDRRLEIFEDEGGLWVVSVQHFRQWYDRLAANPAVVLNREGEELRLRAMPVDDDAQLERIAQRMKQRMGGTRYYLMQALWMFADWKLVRLEAVPATSDR
ncbi:MAG: nitroreductase/quinone reductase family protein [bacterium]|nr:nitroreductase/quinone reductase family protein [bacterium]